MVTRPIVRMSELAEYRRLASVDQIGRRRRRPAAIVPKDVLESDVESGSATLFRYGLWLVARQPAYLPR
jgi:hypothetical protein